MISNNLKKGNDSSPAGPKVEKAGDRSFDRTVPYSLLITPYSAAVLADYCNETGHSQSEVFELMVDLLVAYRLEKKGWV